MSGSILGLGCASMGSRKSRAESLAALERAHAAGIRWFDVAPSYGDGAAEEVLGHFAKGLGPEITIVTKVGILPGHASLAKRLVKPAVRLALGIAPGLRSAVKRSRPAAEKQPITPALIRSSVDASLRRLGKERLDILLLHDATPAEAARDDIIRAMEETVTAGKAARIGIASSPEAVRAGLAATDQYRVAQFANNPFQPGLSRLDELLASRDEVTVITHSVLGSDGMVEAMTARLRNEPTLAARLADAGYAGEPREVVPPFLADYALAARRPDVVLMSMFSRRHLDQNVGRLVQRKPWETIAPLAEMFGAS